MIVALATGWLTAPAWLILAAVQRATVRSSGDPLADIPSLAHALSKG